MLSSYMHMYCVPALLQVLCKETAGWGTVMSFREAGEPPGLGWGLFSASKR